MWRGYQSCGEVTQPLWRGYQICGEITCGEVTLWRGYSQVTGDSPIFRWNQQHFNYILVSVARFLLNCIGKHIGLCFRSWDAEP